MKNHLGAAALIAACLAVAAPAAAETYGSLGLGVQNLDFGAVGAGKASVNTVTGRFGWKSASWYGAEGELYGGLGDDEVSATPKVDVGISTSVALYGVAFAPVGEKVTVHARFGFNRLLGKVKSGATTIDTNDGDISYGVGASYKFSPTKAVRADYTITDLTGVDADAMTVSFVHSF